MDALGAARAGADQLFVLLDRRLSSVDQVLRLMEDFAGDPIWSEGLDVALDNLLTAFSELRDGVETIAGRLALDDPAERRVQLIGELRGVGRRLDSRAAALRAARH